MQVKLASEKMVAGCAVFRGRCDSVSRGAGSLFGCGARDRPLLVVDLDELAAGSDAGKLFEQETALPAATKAKLADELLVSGTAVRGSLDAMDEVAVGVRVRP